MTKLIFDNFSQGANDRLSPRVMGSVRQGLYHGAFPVMHNVDRRAGTLAPRGGELKINSGGACPGTILGMTTCGPFTGDLRYPAATHPEVILVACIDPAHPTTQSRIGRIIPTATSPVFEDLGAISGIGRCRFVDLGTYVYACNGAGDTLIRKSMVTCNGTWTVAASGTPRVVTVSGAAWGNVSCRNIGDRIFLLKSSVWYGPYYVSAATANTVSIADSLGGSYTGPTGAVTTAQMARCDAALLSPPTIPPDTVALGATGSVPDGPSGDYQYCFTWETSDGWESNPTDWGPVVSPDEQAVLVPRIPNEGSNAVAGYEKINVYRRGGTLGDTAIRIATIINEFADLGTPTGLTVIGTGGIDNAVTTIPGDFTGWPTSGMASIPANDYAMTQEWVYYAARSDSQLTSCTRGYWGSGAKAWTAGTLISLVGIVDVAADSDLVDQQLATDHGGVQSVPGDAVKTGSRFYVADLDTNRVYISSALGWRYFSEKNAMEVADLADDYTGGYLDVGADSEPVVRLIAGPDGSVLVFKKESVYAITGRAIWSMQVNKLMDLPGTDAAESVVTFGGSVCWLKGSQEWMWTGDALVDLSDPVRTTMLGISAAYESLAVSCYHDSRILLFYPTGNDGNKKYVEWSLRHPCLYESGQSGPSPTTGDGLTAALLCVSSLRYPDGIVYAAKTTDIWAIMGTGGSGYTYGQAGSGIMLLTTPDLRVASGTEESLLELLTVNLWASGALSAGTLRLIRRFDSAPQTTQTFTIPAMTAAGIQSIYKSLTNDKRGAYIGVALSVPLANMASAAILRSIESVALDIGAARQRPPV